MVPCRSPLGLLPEPGEVHLATLLPWAGRWHWLFPWPACSPGGALRRPLSSPLSQARDVLRVKAMFKTRSKSKRVLPLESLQPPQPFTPVQHSRGAPGLEARGSGGGRARAQSTHRRRSRGPGGPPRLLRGVWSGGGALR